MKSVQYYQNQRAEMMSFIEGHPSVILEIGCGEGNFRNNITWENEYWGVELLPTIAEKARSKLDKVLVGKIESNIADLPDGYFDLVICNDVIEHLPDTVEFLNAISSKLQMGGQLIGSVPNLRFIQVFIELYIKRDWKYVNGGILDSTHMKFFTCKSLNRTLNECGWYGKVEPINPQLQKWWKAPLRWIIQLVFGTDSVYFQIGFNAKRAK
ncbi:MAG: class I SAM-dependent methyltransferase [Kiritimatiellae bacterium]|nr:class I SAM-dependent methyltransferase [Kiritimatiellia bacterium]